MKLNIHRFPEGNRLAILCCRLEPHLVSTDNRLLIQSVRQAADDHYLLYLTIDTHQYLKIYHAFNFMLKRFHSVVGPRTVKLDRHGIDARIADRVSCQRLEGQT